MINNRKQQEWAQGVPVLRNENNKALCINTLNNTSKFLMARERVYQNIGNLRGIRYLYF